LAPRSSPPPKQPARLFAPELRAGISRLQKCIDAIKAFNVDDVREQFDSPVMTSLNAQIDDALVRTFGPESRDYERYSPATDFNWGPVITDEDTPIHEVRDALSKSKRDNIAPLQEAIRSMEERLAEQEHAQQSAPVSIANARSPRKVFVVHGHDEAAREAMARFLEKIELEAVILLEQPDQGLTIIEKFETHASQVSFAVVLLTPDDLGGSASASAQAARARQNVIFELGYFVGKLGRGRACLLRKGGVEIPSDLYGVIYTDMDAADGWKLRLVKELKAAGLSFDANKVWS
jgi:predicted nucleotide-binding protein